MEIVTPWTAIYLWPEEQVRCTVSHSCTRPDVKEYIFISNVCVGTNYSKHLIYKLKATWTLVKIVF